MQKLLFLVTIILITVLVSPVFAEETTEATQPLTYEDLYSYVAGNTADINASIPSYASPLIGNKALQFIIKTPDGTEYAWIEAADGQIARVEKGEHPDPAIRVTTDLTTIDKLTATATDESQGAALIREAVNRKEIYIEFLLIDDIVDAIDAAQPATEATLAIAAPIIAVANPTLLAYLPHFRALIAHFFNWLLGLFGIKKKRQPWATIYDAITKQPLDLAIVRLYKLDGITKRLTATQVTDKAGRFGFLPQTGQHLLEITKPQFTYPSTLVAHSPDNAYETIYRGETLTDKTTEKIIGAGIPLDPINLRDPKAAGNPLLRFIKYILKKISTVLLVIGLCVSLAMVAFEVTLINSAVAILYIALTSLHIRLKPTKTRPWGVVYQSDTLEPVPLATVSIIDTKYHKPLQSRLTDYLGRFAFFPPPGDYTVMVQKSGQQFPSKQKTFTKNRYKTYYGEAFTVHKTNRTTPIDIPLDKAA